MRILTSLMAAAAILPAVGLSGTAHADPATFEFTSVKAPVTDEEKRAVLASPEVKINGTVHKIGYNLIARSGDKIGGNIFGQIYTKDGKPIEVSVDMDFSSLLPVNGKLFNVTHFESRPGAYYVTELSQGADGKLTPVFTKNIDFSAWDGVWVPCAGSVTPWGTHLGSEEYPPNARAIEEAPDTKSLGGDYKYWSPFVRYFGADPEKISIDEYRKIFNPYKYGYAVEVSVDANGNATPFKHYAMGRSAFELANVMPDGKTVYYSDDGTNVGFFTFVADKAGDLKAGTLYALKWNQKHAANGGYADIDWVNLGHSTFETIKKAIDEGVKFSDLFEAAKGDKKTGSCPEGFTSINTTDGFECLKLKPGMEEIASRVETRRYAAYRGATTEFRKEEGITFNPATNTLYVAMSEVERGMEDNAKGGKPTEKYDVGGSNDIRLPANACGTVYALDVAPNAAIGSDYVASNMYGLVSGIPHANAGTPYEGKNKCFIDGISNPDNVTYITGSNTLIIGEDTGSGHQNDVVWAFDTKTGALDRIQTTPYGSETTSPYWYSDVNGFGYLMTVIQHPYGESDQKEAKSEADKAAYNAYIGPFPAMK